MKKAQHTISMSLNGEWLDNLAPVDQKGDIDWAEGLQEWFDTVSSFFNNDDLVAPSTELEMYCSKRRAQRRLERGANYLARLYRTLCDGDLTFEEITSEWAPLETHVRIVDDENEVVGVLVLAVDDEDLIDEDAFEEYEEDETRVPYIHWPLWPIKRERFSFRAHGEDYYAGSLSALRNKAKRAGVTIIE